MTAWVSVQSLKEMDSISCRHWFMRPWLGYSLKFAFLDRAATVNRDFRIHDGT